MSKYQTEKSVVKENMLNVCCIVSWTALLAQKTFLIWLSINIIKFVTLCELIRGFLLSIKLQIAIEMETDGTESLEHRFAYLPN